MPLPLTITKLSQSLTLIGVHQVSETPIPLPENNFSSTGLLNQLKDAVDYGQDLAEFGTSFKRIGAVFGFRVEQSRTNRDRRGLDSAVEPFAIIPGLITTTLTLNRAVLYMQDAMAAFKFSPGNIAFQTRPLIIMEMTTVPQGFNMAQILGLQFDIKLSNPIIYTGCWISSSSMNYDLRGTDQMVVQDVGLNVARVINSLSLIPGIGDIGFRELAYNTSIIDAINPTKVTGTGGLSSLKL